MRNDPSGARLEIDDLARVPEIVAALVADGIRITRVEPHRPTLEDLYFLIRRQLGGEARSAGLEVAGALIRWRPVDPLCHRRRPARRPTARCPITPVTPTAPTPTNQRSIRQGEPDDTRRDQPRDHTEGEGTLQRSPHVDRGANRPASTAALQGLPAAHGGSRNGVLRGHTDCAAADTHPGGQLRHGRAVSDSLEILPASRTVADPRLDPWRAYRVRLAVFLFAPVAVVVPLTISTAVGAATIVGERERGTGEFLAHSPASTREIYLGKLIASVIPGYVTTIVGFGLYSLMVNLVVGPDVGGWFFPTAQWWVMMLWIIPPFLLVALSLVLRLSARVRSTAAAQQASGLITLPMIGIAYSQATGSLLGSGAGGHAGWIVGAFAWLLAVVSLQRGVRSVTRNRLLGVAQ
ncbi:MAG: ABC transporter permease subunit [Microthrixaceae bacterium]|nr:ABC transporter permease subunit [Microthrixaceae bacterium]